MTEQSKPFASMGYAPVPGLMNRIISRYLRTQRKNMRRFFEERGLFAFADRMDQIRKSRQDMFAKNRMFQKVLNDYSRLANPSVSSGAADVPAGVPDLAQQPAPIVIADETENP